MEKENVSVEPREKKGGRKEKEKHE